MHLRDFIQFTLEDDKPQKLLSSKPSLLKPLQVCTQESFVNPFAALKGPQIADERPYTWIALVMYWTAAISLGHYAHYPEKLFGHGLVPNSLARHNVRGHTLFGMALLVTAAAQLPYWRACGKRARAERDLHWGSLAVFALVNGFAETFFFLFAFDTGLLVAEFFEGLAPFRETLGAYGLRCFECVDDRLYLVVSFILGCLLMCIYCGFIHATFWEPLVFPPHLPAGGQSPQRRQMKWAILCFTAMTLLWAAVYFFNNGDLWAVCLLHIVADVGAGVTLRIQPPWVAGGAPIFGEGETAVLPGTPRIVRAPSITPPLASAAASPRTPSITPPLESPLRGVSPLAAANQRGSADCLYSMGLERQRPMRPTGGRPPMPPGDRPRHPSRIHRQSAPSVLLTFDPALHGPLTPRDGGPASSMAPATDAAPLPVSKPRRVRITSTPSLDILDMSPSPSRASPTCGSSTAASCDTDGSWGAWPSEGPASPTAAPPTPFWTPRFDDRQGRVAVPLSPFSPASPAELLGDDLHPGTPAFPLSFPPTYLGSAECRPADVASAPRSPFSPILASQDGPPSRRSSLAPADGLRGILASPPMPSLEGSLLGDLEEPLSDGVGVPPAPIAFGGFAQLMRGSLDPFGGAPASVEEEPPTPLMRLSIEGPATPAARDGVAPVAAGAWLSTSPDQSPSFASRPPLPRKEKLG